MNSRAPAAPSVSAALYDATRRLRTAGVPGPRRDARLLLGDAMGVHPALLDPGAVVTPLAAFQEMIRRREAREPVSRIVGRREFWSLPFSLSGAVLDPRPDSETIVSEAVSSFGGCLPPRRILDLGTGSGCLVCALLTEFPFAWGIGIDNDPAAIAAARANASQLGLGDRTAFAVGSWGEALYGTFELIVANPPYVATSDLGYLDPEVIGYDPRQALDGGADGLESIRALAPNLSRLAGNAGRAFVEVGAGQAQRAGAIFSAAGFVVAAAGRDLAGNDRVVRMTRN